MGIDLTNDAGGEFDLTSSGWAHLHVFAEAHGWRAPTPEREDEEGRVIYDADTARAMADAVESGMGNGTPPEIAARVSAELTAIVVEPTASTMFRVDPVRMTERGVAHWREFIAFARQGEFRISY